MREYVSFCSFPNTGQHLRAPDLASPFCARPVVCSIMVVEKCASRHVTPDAHYHPVFPWPTRVDPEAEISSCGPNASLGSRNNAGFVQLVVNQSNFLPLFIYSLGKGRIIFRAKLYSRQCAL